MLAAYIPGWSRGSGLDQSGGRARVKSSGNSGVRSRETLVIVSSSLVGKPVKVVASTATVSSEFPVRFYPS